MRIAYLAELVLLVVPGTVIAIIDALVNWGHLPFAVVVLSPGWNIFAPSFRLLLRRQMISNAEWIRLSRYGLFGLIGVMLWIGFLITAYSSRWSWSLGTWIQLVVIVVG